MRQTVLRPPRCPLTPVYGHLIGHYSLLMGPGRQEMEAFRYTSYVTQVQFKYRASKLTYAVSLLVWNSGKYFSLSILKVNLVI